MTAEWFEERHQGREESAGQAMAAQRLQTEGELCCRRDQNCEGSVKGLDRRGQWL